MKATPDLFSSLSLGDLELANRVVMAPMTRNRAERTGEPREAMAKYYQQRAGAGLIISEASQVCLEGQGYPCTPGIHTPEQISAWRKVTSAVHASHGKIFIQLWHCGRISHSSYQPDGSPPPAPSAIKPSNGAVITYQGPKPFEMPRALETSEVQHIAELYRKASRAAIDAGFDGVEIHAANGYLLDQFLRDGSNKRTDIYGGAIENRARLLLEVVDQVCGEISPARVGVRLSPNGTFNDMRDSDPKRTFNYTISKLSDRKLAYLHFIEKMSGDPAITVTIEDARHWFAGTLMVNGGFDRDRASSLISSGLADLVSFGVPFIANPDLVDRFQRGAALNEPDTTTFYGGDERGYTDYPTL